MTYPAPEPAPAPPPAESSLRESANIQGNILAGFRKDHQTFLFLRFADPEQARSWLGKVARRIATTAQVASFNREFSRARRHRGGDDPEHLKAVWLGLSLTAPGISVLAPDLLSGDLSRFGDLHAFEAFRNGAGASAPKVGDTGASHPAGWLIGREGEDIHALLTVAADDPRDLAVELDRQRTAAAAHGLVVVVEQEGNTLPGRRAGHEHFGFKDGISQPAVRGFDDQASEARDGAPGGSPPETIETVAPGEFLIGHPGQDGSVRAAPEWMADGSFHVFRRLRQDVPGWWGQVETQRERLPAIDGVNADLLAAKLVGRWRSGTPLDHAPGRDNRSAQAARHDNDFEFDDDPDGESTPRFAHIRKVYPRKSSPPGDDESERRRIIRRGIPFGPPFDPTAGRGHGVDAPRGLLFHAFMASIEDQFEFLQASWANAPGFPAAGDGADPVIGTDSSVTLKLPGQPDQSLEFRRLVFTEAAVYAFAASIQSMTELAEGTLAP